MNDDSKSVLRGPHLLSGVLPRTRGAVGWRILTLVFVAWCIGQIARDRYWWTGICFYIPSPLVAAGMVGCALWQGLRGRRRRSVLILCGAVLPLVTTLWVENRRVFDLDTDPAQALDLRLVHWNVCWGDYGWEGIEERLVELQADIYVISERPPYAETLSLLNRLGPEFQAHDLLKVMIVARGDVLGKRTLIQTEEGQLFMVDWQWQDHQLRIMTADLASDILLARDPALREVRQFAKHYQPDFIVGDFNAPRRSRQFALFPPGYRHAYDWCGKGIGYTWPVPVPVYALDQCILGPRIRAGTLELQSSWFSDHRIQVLDFSLER